VATIRPEDPVTTPQKGIVLVVVGPGGVGKGSVVRRLLNLRPDVWLSRSWTTRARRPGESEDAYVWVERDQFLARAAAGGFVEWTEFPGNGRLYGTPTIEGADGRDVVLEIELDGAQQVKRRQPDAVLVLVVAPSADVQKERMRGRGDDEASLARRVAYGAKEEELGRQVADHVIVNDDLDEAAAELAGILDSHRSGR
jgi:guanylate kinase